MVSVVAISNKCITSHDMLYVGADCPPQTGPGNYISAAYVYIYTYIYIYIHMYVCIYIYIYV